VVDAGEEIGMTMDRMYDSAEAFAKGLDALVDEAMDNADQLIRKTIIDLSTAIVVRTPHDTGRARAGWISTANTPSEFVPPEGDYPSYQGENPSLKRVSKLAKSKSWEWWLVNNVEYIQPLEDGHSSIAPQGMVAVSLQSFADHLSQNLRQSEYWDDA
jgi:hypothetical protein